MKKIILILAVALSLISCGRGNLYDVTDKIVDSLYTEYESYGTIGDIQKADDGYYSVIPTGRMIIVKINKAVKNNQYENLKNDLKSHYKGNKKVNDVYINRGGTVVIDCRRIR